AITTMLGVVPILTGASFDFHIWQMVWQSESAEWWLSMAVVIFFGLGVATLLTLVVVPALFSLAGEVREWLAARGYLTFGTALMAGAPVAAATAAIVGSAAPWFIWLAVTAAFFYQTPVARHCRDIYWQWWWRYFDGRHKTNFADRYTALLSALPAEYKEED
ncbi:MAG: hypothetical protein N3A66_04025, partial [Planctomycetota bacterium]|nr:hypothetical protein [Planctomycetota bacterium]